MQYIKSNPYKSMFLLLTIYSELNPLSQKEQRANMYQGIQDSKWPAQCTYYLLGNSNFLKNVNTHSRSLYFQNIIFIFLKCSITKTSKVTAICNSRESKICLSLGLRGNDETEIFSPPHVTASCP